MINMVNGSLNETAAMLGAANMTYMFKGQDFRLLTEFQTRTVLTMGNKASRSVYQEHIVRLASTVSLDIRGRDLVHTDSDESMGI